MIIVKIFFWILSFMFFVGMAGSAIVVILTSIEDVKELREKKDEGSASRIGDPNLGNPMAYQGHG